MAAIVSGFLLDIIGEHFGTSGERVGKNQILFCVVDNECIHDSIITASGAI